jgi:DNA-binding NarL/FixJ family response regulator
MGATRLGLMLNVAVLDDHPAVLAGLRRLIDSEPDLTVMAAAATAPELALRLDGMRADVLVLDDDLTRGDGLAHCLRLKNRAHPPAVVIYSAHVTPSLVLAARVAQADGLIDKAEPVCALLTAIRRVADDQTVIPAVPRHAYQAAVAQLDDNDLPILALLLDGESLPAIAETLSVDRTDVAQRVHRIIGRLRPRIRTRPEEKAAETNTRGPTRWP